MRPCSTLVRAIPFVALLLAVGLAGCDLMTTRSPSPRPSRLVSTPEPQPSPTPTEVAEVPTIRPAPTGPDLVEAANALADLDSYRVSVVTRGLVAAKPANGQVTMVSTLVQGGDPAARFLMTGVDGFAAGRLEAIVIADQAWLKEGFGPWRKSPGGAADFDAAFTTMSPIDLLTEFEGLGPALSRAGIETRNGRKAVHYTTSADDSIAAEAGLSKGSVDAWFAATGGDLVAVVIDGKWDLDGTPTQVLLHIDVSRINDRSNTVRPPG